MRKHHSALGGVALGLALTLTGCADQGNVPASQQSTNETASDTPSPTATSTSTPKTAEEKAVAQLTAYLDLRDDAFRAATIDLKQLNKVATGQQFLNIQQNVSAIQRSGSKVTGEYIHTLGEPRSRGAYMLIIDCEDRSGVSQTKFGRPVPDPVGPDGQPVPNPLAIEYKLIKEDGRWLVGDQNGLLEESC